MGNRSIPSLFKEQLGKVPPLEKYDLTGKVVLVVGANTGLGWEAARHFATMNPARLLLACRSKERGTAAIERIKEVTGFERAELLLVDLSSFDSVKAFADRFEQEVERLDILVNNAAVSLPRYEDTEDGWEQNLQVNYISPTLLLLRLLPKLVKTAEAFKTTPRVTIVASGMHQFGEIPKGVFGQSSVLSALSGKEKYTPLDANARYCLTKLLNVLSTLSFNDHVSPSIAVNSVDPGFCYSELRRDLPFGIRMVTQFFEKIVARTAEEGSRQLVWAALAKSSEEELMKGAYVTSMEVREPSDFVVGKKGKDFREELFTDTLNILSAVDPKVKPIRDQYLH
ncbi:hypothetical protein PC9H_002118 [Pleurotus ostreatus]|uniref:Uncharacterized protein n=1 Tax=Pleurotus ostreatus TaxID=5322 RepID=A0A8H7DMT6_PLEOS|nr:uncharacterized protein PC9H_002118 [Pleurotus ostreatus]KAF7419527.1 hypothetical protein PC9H_002118 [Pleurotus ostreatus]KAJ8689640.1 hypothetical protein PTI98_012523 [Pleurotus ostreatus]